MWDAIWSTEQLGMKAMYLCPREARQGTCKGVPPFPRSVLLSLLILILQCQEKSGGYRSCRVENVETACGMLVPDTLE